MIETKPSYEVFVSEEFDTDVCEENLHKHTQKLLPIIFLILAYIQV